MAKRNYGKVKRSKNLYKKKKSGFRKVIETAITAVLVVGLSFVGYTIAKTILEYEPSENNNNDVSVDVLPIETVDINNENPGEPEDDGSGTPNHEPSASTPEYSGNAIYAPSTVLESSASLSAFLESARSSGFEAVVIELKNSDGRLLYNSEIPVLQGADIIAGTLTAEQIVAACTSAGLKPVARINTLMDQLAPRLIGSVSYRFADGNYAWMDGRPEAGGKQWANPFLDGTKAYIAELTEELFNAGFADVVFVNTIFPNFHPVDINNHLTGNPETDFTTRFTALVSLVNNAAEKVPGANIMLEMSLSDIVNPNEPEPMRTAEILRGVNDLNIQTVIITFTRDDTEAVTTGDGSAPLELPGRIVDMFTKAQTFTNELEIIPLLADSGLSEIDREVIISAFYEMGLENYMLRN